MISDLQYLIDIGEPKHTKGIRMLFKFPNGYQASCIQNDWSYGGGQELWEVAAINPEGNIIALEGQLDIVMGWLDDEAAEAAVERIRKL
jgi:hypothetical protein